MKTAFLGYGVLAKKMEMALEASFPHTFEFHRFSKTSHPLSRGIPPCDWWVISVRPHQFEDLLRDLSNLHASHPLHAPKQIISLMAGITLDRLRRALKEHLGFSSSAYALSRLMPNKAMSVQEGILLHCGDATLLPYWRALGCLQELTSEDMINDFTAVTASAPAYVWTIAHYLQDFLIKRTGITEERAKELVLIMIKGCVIMAEQVSFKDLAHQTATPQGMTEQGLKYLVSMGQEEMLKEALSRAAFRGKELESLFSK